MQLIDLKRSLGFKYIALHNHLVYITKSQGPNGIFHKVIIYPVPSIKVIPGQSVEQRVRGNQNEDDF